MFKKKEKTEKAPKMSIRDRTYAGKAVNLHKQKFEETITAVRSVTYVPD